ncbi:Nuclear control of ATPase protein 2 [Paramarasmius palmivorus]|uniref:Nuclear control of ATPase protein 2 n=1 Tax=Paramarasmius palmivorus TaxID=297713 RepID=A0AAW0DWX4_9AGAR
MGLSSAVQSYVLPLHECSRKPLSNVSQDVIHVQLADEKVEETKQKLHSVLASLDDIQSLESTRLIEQTLGTLSELGVGSDVVYTALEEQPRKDFERVALERTVLNKAVVSLYAQALQLLLSQSVEIESEMEWWSDVERSRLSVAYYLLQTFPCRLLNMLQTIQARLREEGLPLRVSQLTPSSLRSLFPSRGFFHPSILVTSLFPHLHDDTQLLPTLPAFYGATTKESQSLPSMLSQLANCIWHFIALPYHLTRQECLYKRHQLEILRDQRASTLGELAQARVHLSQTLEADDLKLLHSFLLDMERTLSVGGSMPQGSALSTLQNLSSVTLSRAALLHTQHLQSNQLLRPSRITLIWPKLLLGPPLLLYVASTLYHSRGSLLELAHESKEVVKGFVVDWLIEPLMGVIDTVRSKDRSVIVSKEGVEADFDSLERMALSLAKDQLHYGPEQLAELSRQVRAGDLTPVLKLYEEDIRSPLKSAFTGTLLRTVFIQVQKAKVDIDQALAGIDRLLKSQELTFAFVGVAPALSIVYLSAGYLRRVWEGGRGRGQYGGKHQRATVLFAMRRIERLLIHDQGSTVKPLTSGLLMLSVAQLQAYADTYLPDRSRLKAGFLEDVQDLQNPVLGGNERRMVLERMWRSWGSILGLGTVAGEGITI